MAKRHDPREFQAWIDRVLREQRERFPTPTALARTMKGMKLGPFNRGLADGKFSFDRLLLLAKATGEHPSKVLRMAGKGDDADLIESLYGPAQELTADQRDVVERWRRLSAHGRSVVGDVLRKYSGDSGEADSEEGADPPATSRRAGRAASAHR